MNYGQRMVGINYNVHNLETPSEMAWAVRAKDITEVKRLLEQGVPADIPDGLGYNPIHRASRYDDAVEIVRVLTSSGADIEHKAERGETPLFIACSNSCEKIVEFFLSCNCQVNNADSRCVTPLHIACKKTNNNIIKMLIEAGADLNAKDYMMRTPLFNTIHSKNPTAVKMLLEAGCDAETSDWANLSPLAFSVEVGHMEIFDIMIERVGLSKKSLNQQDSDGRTLLMKALEFTNYDIAKKLIRYGVDASPADSREKLALHWAAKTSRVDLFRLVLHHTPKDVIERYSTDREELEHLRSLPCMLMDENMFDGLKLLFEYGVSDQVLCCPSRFGDDELVSPVSYLLLYAHNLDQFEAVRYLELLLSREALKDPVYDEPTSSVVRSVDAAIRSHEIDHENCNCLQLLTMLLDKGVDPDVPLDFRIPQPFLNAMDSCFIRGLSSLLAHSNLVEPEHLLDHVINYLSSRNYEWSGRQAELMKFLVWASTDLNSLYGRIIEVTSLPGLVSPAVIPFFEMITTKALEVQSLKNLSRLSVRKLVRFETSDNPKMFRNVLKSLPIPRALVDFLLYQELLEYID